MSKRKKLKEVCKDVLIILLTCSALMLAVKTRLMAPLSPGQGSGTGPGGAETGQSAGRAGTARPIRICANGTGGAGDGRCAVQYSRDDLDALFQKTGPLLLEALSGAGEAEKTERRYWEDALTGKPGFCFDFGGAVPLEMLPGWQPDGFMPGQTAVRRIAITLDGRAADIFFLNEADGSCFRSRSSAEISDRAAEILALLPNNGAFYAFEERWCDGIDPDTLFQPDIPAQSVYQAGSPVSGSRADLEQLMKELDLPVSSSSFYLSGDEMVARSGNDMLRLSKRGTARYEADGESDSFPVPRLERGSSLLEAVEACRRVAAATLAPRTGAARLYLLSAESSQKGTEVVFGYNLDGMPVWLDRGEAARFLVRSGHIVRFELNFRSYTDSGTDRAVLPPRQAAAAMDALALNEQELVLLYEDSGRETVAAGWAAVRRDDGEE